MVLVAVGTVGAAAGRSAAGQQSTLFLLDPCAAATLSMSRSHLHLPSSLEQDAQGRVFMWDKAGNIYYDTEDARTGVYMVSGAKLPLPAAAAAFAAAKMTQRTRTRGCTW